MTSSTDKRRTSFDLTGEEMAALRELAAALGYMTTRGPGAGQIGSITAMLARLARTYDERPKDTALRFEEILQVQHSQGGRE